MKALVAAACVAIIAAVGYYFWGEWRRAADAAERQNAVTLARLELFKFAKAEPHETAKVRAFCERAQSLDDDTDNDILIGLARNCRVLGYYP